MSLLRLYFNLMPLMVIFPTIIGINTAVDANKRQPPATSFHTYSNVIGYTGVGLITGITYPISFPLFGAYVLYKQSE